MKRTCRIAGTGAFLPPRVVTAAEIDARTGAEPGWTAARVGVLERRWVTDENASFMGASAVRQALADAGVTLDDIDALVCCAAVGQQAIPCTAALVLAALGRDEADISAFDIDATCLSFVVGLDLLSMGLMLERWKRVVLVSAEIASVGLDFAHKESAALFGDGAVAVVLEPSDEPGILACDQRMFPDGADLCHIPGGGTAIHPSHPKALPSDFVFHMHGPGLYLMAAEFLPPFTEQLLRSAGCTLDDIDLVVPHQASLPALELMGRSMGISPDRFWVTARRIGNLIAASIPMGLHLAREAGRLRPGHRVLLLGTSAGFGVGGAVLQVD